MVQSIDRHGIVGDLRTIALVGMTGAVDFMCWPNFDSPTIFAGLLDPHKGGCFELAPVLQDANERQLYLTDSNVLLTRYLSEEGVAEISDFMPLAHTCKTPRLVRRVKSVRGTMEFRMRCAPRFDYARAEHTVRDEDGTIVFASHNLSLRLRSDIELAIDGTDAVAKFALKPGQTAFLILEDAGEGLDCASNAADFVAVTFKATLDFWRNWISRSTYRGRWRDMVHRSALALKLLTSHEHGAIIAAGTFGLPETIGGERNWDYRYAWLRDSAFTVYAFLRLGFTAEADAFMDWLGARVGNSGEDGQIQLMYSVDGQTDLTEVVLDHFDGYQGSRPVRIGNAASKQLQLDIYGELLDAIYLSDKYGKQMTYKGWEGTGRALDWVAANWNQPDEGIWEVRSGRGHFLHSRVMLWVALDRGVRLARKRSLPADLETWIKARDEIYRDIHENFWSEKRQAFVQRNDGDAIDASCLLMPLVRFISPTDPRFLSTMKAVSQELMDDSLVYRYTSDAPSDGLQGAEGTFNMCSFWFVECLARAGDIHQARFLFEKMLGYANHLGLFAEETGRAGQQLGNFPQAFTHLALISAAYYLDRCLDNETPGHQGTG